MQIEKRNGTANNYVVHSQRISGKLEKRYIGKASDPVVQLYLEDERLAQANERAYHEACAAEKADDIEASKSLEWLCQWSSQWKVLRQIYEQDMHSKQAAPTTTFRLELPGLHKFKDTCRRAQDGDADAQQLLDAWIAESPELLAEATDMIAVTREYLVGFVSSASSETSMLWQKRIDSDTSAILEDAGDDRLSRMFAEVAVLAWLDVMRCSLMPSLAGDDLKRSSYWGSVLRQSQKRWLKVSTAFQQHVKQSKKSRPRKSSKSNRDKACAE
ncbi:hypothetical protein Pla22_41690 [Rubripirellula amarantea]|uniref:Uncharacterized protein n=1 Tax=Rubripirellula amarantea TaxID=2527999 RepID=A0A5C5WMR6_9BACT|nr:hypothetical protein [Rubripirellula amarantea]TWT51391.1 hypothetical protein Pla22_41690 [Rubripirellula amarantea]